MAVAVKKVRELVLPSTPARFRLTRAQRGNDAGRIGVCKFMKASVRLIRVTHRRALLRLRMLLTNIRLVTPGFYSGDY